MIWSAVCRRGAAWSSVYSIRGRSDAPVAVEMAVVVAVGVAVMAACVDHLRRPHPASVTHDCLCSYYEHDADALVVGVSRLGGRACVANTCHSCAPMAA